jgi:hypothetical protein
MKRTSPRETPIKRLPALPALPAHASARADSDARLSTPRRRRPEAIPLLQYFRPAPPALALDDFHEQLLKPAQCNVPLTSVIV